MRCAAAKPPAVVAFGDPGTDTVLEDWAQADPSTQAYVVHLARRAFDTFVRSHVTIDCPADLPPLLRERTGIFISTMGPNGAPRCCMGTLYPTESDAAHEIIRSAVAAAGQDLRFSPIVPSELGRLRLIVTAVGQPESITEDEAKRLDPTRDAVVVQNGGRYGVMLSGETPHIDLMLRWGRIRAGAGPGATVTFLRIRDVRIMEGL